MLPMYVFLRILFEGHTSLIVTFPEGGWTMDTPVNYDITWGGYTNQFNCYIWFIGGDGHTSLIMTSCLKGGGMDTPF